jgi:hypothetical protein
MAEPGRDGHDPALGDGRDDRLAELLDQAAIVDLTHRMVGCFDLLDWAALEGCFLDEIDVRYEYVVDDGVSTMSAEAFVEAWRGAMSGLEATQHLLANHQVDVEGDEATCTAYCLVQHYYPDPAGGSTWTLGGHYDLALARTDEGWRIGALEMTVVWAQGNGHLLDQAARVPSDAVADRRPVPDRGGE